MTLPETNVASATSGQETENVQASYNLRNSPFDIGVIVKVLWKSKLFIVCFSCLFAICTAFYAFSLPNVYKSNALLVPVSSEGSTGGTSQLGGLASLAGISLGSSSTNKTTLALAIIKSRTFIESFITKHNLLVPILAAESWDVSKQQYIYDEEKYDLENKTWNKNNGTNESYKPSLWRAYKKFSDFLMVFQDDNTSLITISIEHYSPKHIQQWLNLLIEDINEYMRIEDELEAKASIVYLSQKLAETKIKNMEMVFYQLIEEQNKNLMLTKVKKQYVLKTIESALLPEEKVKPKRMMLILFGSFFGVVLSMFLTLSYVFFKQKR